MNWFQRHINWTYIILLIIATLIYAVATTSTSIQQASAEELYGVHIYLDSSYSREWNNFNQPDFNRLTWGPDAENGENWESAVFTSYLENTGPLTLDVYTQGYQDLSSVAPGWGVSSETIRLKPGEKSPLDSKLSHNTWLSVTPMIYYQARPTEVSQSGDWYWVPYMLAFVVSAGWALHQKGRSYGWLLLSLSGIGVIIILWLENKRTKVQELSYDGIDESDVN